MSQLWCLCSLLWVVSAQDTWKRFTLPPMAEAFQANFVKDNSIDGRLTYDSRGRQFQVDYFQDLNTYKIMKSYYFNFHSPARLWEYESNMAPGAENYSPVKCTVLELEGELKSFFGPGAWRALRDLTISESGQTFWEDDREKAVVTGHGATLDHTAVTVRLRPNGVLLSTTIGRSHWAFHHFEDYSALVSEADRPEALKALGPPATMCMTGGTKGDEDENSIQKYIPILFPPNEEQPERPDAAKLRPNDI